MGKKSIIIWLNLLYRNKNYRRKLLKRSIFIGLTVLFLAQCLLALSNPPKREFRAAWIASVANIDWPKTLSPSKQKRNLIKLLDELDETGINAVILQIRPECDALYNSNYEPWSYWLTGKQGKAPDPYYDPLEFAIEEAHKRGMELHAWFNPYRAEKTIGGYTLAENHVVKQHPEWILSFTETDSKMRLLNPGIPDVRRHIINVIMDVVNRYDVDGIHFDDYFYPYPPNNISRTNKDYQTYKTYKHGDASDNSIEAWRRENINILMRMIHDSIQVVKPWVKFGISPFGIYKNGVPPGITGMDAYNVIYADPLAWLRDQSIDYITPQLYWKIGGAQDFSKLLNWWADQTAAKGRHLYPGHIFGGSFSTSELPNQLNLVRKNSKSLGDVYFSAKHFGYNTLDFAEKLKNDYYRFPALVPQMDWKNLTAPEAPTQLLFAQPNSNKTSRFRWQAQPGASGGGVIRFALYRFDQMPSTTDPPDDPSKLYKVIGGNEFLPKPPKETLSEVYFAITAIDRNSNESTLGPVIRITPPSMPALALPQDGNNLQPDTVIVSWNLNVDASTFYLQIATDTLFNDLVFDKNGIADDSLKITDLTGQTQYFWRVAAENPAGRSDFSDVFSFATAFPMAPILASPPDGESNVPLDTVLTWYKNEVATSYHVQLGQSETFSESFMTYDTVVTDTFLVVNNLEEFKRKWYYWRVKALNEYGSSDWSETYMFRTIQATYLADMYNSPKSFELKQNYPNPFNPTTNIEFTLAKGSRATLKIYNMLGQEVLTLVNEYKPAGSYKVTFDATNLAAGVYVYQLRAGNLVANKKMILIK